MNRDKWVIGDIHGCFATLMALILKLPKGTKSEDIIYVGDMIDRGPDNRAVINYIRESGSKVVKGNHEDMMCDAYEEYIEDNIEFEYSGWCRNGGNVCLEEYVDKYDMMDWEALKTDYEWFNSLPIAIIEDQIIDTKGRKLLISHSHAAPYVDNYIKSINKVAEGLTEHISEFMMVEYEHQMTNSEQTILWNRKIPHNKDSKYFNIFGHTPIDNFINDKKYLTPEKVIVDTDIGYANIDSGCVYTKKHKEYRGKLTAISFPGLKVIQQENIDD